MLCPVQGLKKYEGQHLYGYTIHRETLEGGDIGEFDKLS